MEVRNIDFKRYGNEFAGKKLEGVGGGGYAGKKWSFGGYGSNLLRDTQ